jgi:hypothetical protein
MVLYQPSISGVVAMAPSPPAPRQTTINTKRPIQRVPSLIRHSHRRTKRDYRSPYFINNLSNQTAELENPYILLYDKKISNVREMLALLEGISKAGRPLLVVAEDVE